MPDDTLVLVVEDDEMSVAAKVEALRTAGRKELAVEVLRVIDAMHGKEIVVRLREFVLHEIDPHKHAAARLPGYARRKIAEMAADQPEPEAEPEDRGQGWPAEQPVTEPKPEDDQAEGESDWLEELSDEEEAAKQAAAESEQPA